MSIQWKVKMNASRPDQDGALKGSCVFERSLSRFLVKATRLIILLCLLSGIVAPASAAPLPAKTFQDDVTRAPSAPGVVLVGLKPGLRLHTSAGPRAAQPAAPDALRYAAVVQSQLADLAVQQVDPLFDFAGNEPAPAFADGSLNEGMPDSLARIYRLKLAAGASIDSALASLARNPQVEFAEPDYQALPALIPNDPLYAQQWGMAMIQAPSAWQAITGTAGTTLAIVDGGLDPAQPDLAGSLWVNPGEQDQNSLDDDNNGLVDDVNGWDFVNGTNQPLDENGHGTEVAGVAGARGNNAQGTAGMCWGCRLMAVKVSGASGAANYSDIAAGVAYAAAKGAQVINISLGGYANSNALRAAVQAAASSAVVVASAGNDHTDRPFYPAAYPDVLAVAAVGVDGARAPFSNYGPWVDLAAPGVSITTTWLGAAWGPASGTSLAAPAVSGLAGLVYSQHPDWTPVQVRQHLLRTAHFIDAQMGAGLIDAAAAVQPPSPHFIIDSLAVNGVMNGRPTPGSAHNSLAVRLFNDWYDAASVTVTLTSDNPAVRLLSAQAAFGDIAAGSKASGAPYTFAVEAGAGDNQPLRFALDVQANDGVYQATLPFTLTTTHPAQSLFGQINQDTAWISSTEYTLDNDLIIAQGVTLRIQAGTIVRLKPNVSLIVNGALIAAGTPEQPVRFRPADSARWNRIQFNDSSQDGLADGAHQYLSGSYLKDVVLEASAAGVGCDKASPYLQGLTSASSGIRCAPGAAPLHVISSTLSGGVYVTLGTIYARGNTLSGQGLIATGSGVVMSTTVTGASLSISSGTLLSNTVHGGSLGLGSSSIAHGNQVVGGGISAGGSVTIQNNLVTGGGISAGSSALVISNTVQQAPHAGLTCGNNVIARGNRLVSNEQGMVVTTGLIQSNLIAYSHSHGLQVGAATVISNTFTANSGNSLLIVGGAPLKIQGNNFEANNGPYDLYVNIPWSGLFIPATRNWWGSADATVIAARIYDFNDNSSRAKTTYVNWLSGPAETAPAYVRSVNISPDNVLGIQTGTFQAVFSRAMNAAAPPPLTFYTARRGQWERYSAQNSGLPADRVSALALDLAYNPWFGASQGAATLAGDAWKVYTPDNSPLPDRQVNVITSDPDGALWFGTPSGAASLSADAWQVYTATPATLPSNQVLDIAVDQDRAKWFATDAGVAWFDGASWITYTQANSGLPSNRINAIAQDQDRVVWFATDAGLASFDGLAWTVYNAANTVLPSNRVQEVAVDLDHVKWIGADLGLARFDGSTWTVYTATAALPSNDVRAISVDPNNVKWVATQGGLSSFDGVRWTQFQASPSGLPSNRLLAVLADSQGWKWVGSEDGGAAVLIDSPDYAVNLNPTWTDSKQYQASFEFNALTARGVYSLAVGSAVGLDGVWSAPNYAYTFTVDYATSVWDRTPPPAPSVQVTAQSGLNAVSASWAAADPNSGIDRIQYAIGLHPGGSEVVGWGLTASQNLNNAQSERPLQGRLDRDRLNLISGQVYYLSVQARNAGGLWSRAGAGEFMAGRTPDATPPLTPQVSAAASSTTAVQLTWSSSDPESGIAAYRYAIGSTPGGVQVVDWTQVGAATTSVSLTNLSLTAGGTYYAYVQAQNSQGMWSEVGGASFNVATAPRGSQKLYLPLTVNQDK